MEKMAVVMCIGYCVRFISFPISLLVSEDIRDVAMFVLRYEKVGYGAWRS